MDLPTTHHDYHSATDVKGVGENTSVKNVFGQLSLYILLAPIFLAPLAFIPSVYAPSDTVKTIVIAVGIILSSLFSIISSMKSPRLHLSRWPIVYASVAIIVSLIISSILSSSFTKSFIGQSFEIGTTSFLILMFLSTWLVTRLSAQNKETVLKIYMIIFLSSIVIGIVHIARLIFGPEFMTLGILTSPISTLVGKWYDLGIIMSISGLISFFGLKFLPSGKSLKILMAVTLVLSGIFLFIINSILIWTTLSFIFLCVFIYEYRHRIPQSVGFKRFLSRISLLTFISLLIAVVCAWKGPVLAGPLSHSLKVDQGEVILPWQLTLDVAADTIKESPLFGSGPNKFGAQYLKFKPLDVNPTPFWNSEFTSGFGLIPTFIVSQGIIGFITWILFFIFFLREGWRSLRKTHDKLKRFSVVSSFFIATFLWLMNIIYVPSHAMIFMTFIFTGLFLSTLVGEGSTQETATLSPHSKYRKSILAIYTIFAVSLFFLLTVYVKNTAAIVYFQKGIKELNTTKNVDKAQAYFKKALAINPSDIYYQAMSEVDIIKITALAQTLQDKSAPASASSTPEKQPNEKTAQQIIALVDDAYGYTKKAIAYDPTNYYNYISQARISEIAASFRFSNAYESAKASYLNALQANPHSPLLYLNLARLEVSQNKLSEALPYIGTALQLKQNYTEAVFLLSQIQIANNQTKEAIASTRFASQINPNDPIIFFQLGILEYNDKNYTDAALALEKAVNLNNQYANARYFLGLSYARLGKNADAIAQFEEIAKTNADNQEVQFILSNLKAGKSPFADAKPPIDNKPEKRKNLPVVDKSAIQKSVPSSASVASTTKMKK